MSEVTVGQKRKYTGKGGSYFTYKVLELKGNGQVVVEILDCTDNDCIGKTYEWLLEHTINDVIVEV